MQGATIFNLSLIGAGLPVATVTLDGTTPLLNLSHLEVPEITSEPVARQHAAGLPAAGPSSLPFAYRPHHWDQR